MEVIIQPDAEAVSKLAAAIFRRQLTRQPRSVLGLATGSTPLGLYRELVAAGLDWSGVTTFNLDEYVGLGPEHPQSYARYMREHLFSHINLPPESAHLPAGLARDIPAHCEEYESRIRAAGGIDLQLLGLGANGHIGFNEPSSSLASRTRLKSLTRRTIEDNARFFPEPESAPRHVITMGVGTILESRQCLVLALGEKKAHAVAATVEGPVMADVPGSALQLHARSTLILDEAAAVELRRADYYRWVFANKPEWQRA